MGPASSSRSPIPRASAKPRKTVVFDSSFLISVMEHPTPWREDMLEKFGAFTPVVLRSVRGELERLAARNDKRAGFASLALGLIKDGVFSLQDDGGGEPDDEIVSFALKEGAAVATIDSELAKRLRASRVKTVVSLRGGRVWA